MITLSSLSASLGLHFKFIKTAIPFFRSISRPTLVVLVFLESWLAPEHCLTYKHMGLQDNV